MTFLGYRIGRNHRPGAVGRPDGPPFSNFLDIGSRPACQLPLALTSAETVRYRDGLRAEGPLRKLPSPYAKESTMRPLKTLKVMLLSSLAGLLAALFFNSGRVAADGCPNTYCIPGSSGCSEFSNWACYLDGGCAGTSRCS